MDKIIEIINNIPNIDLQLIEDYIVNSNSSKCIYEYCLNGKYLNIKSLEDKLLDLNQLAFICLFAIKIKGANIIRIEEYIRNNCKIEYIKEIVEFYEIMINIGLMDISKYEDTIIKLNNPRYMYDLARKYKNCNLLKIEAAIIKSNDSEYIYKFAKYKCVNLEKLEDALIRLNDLYYLVLFSTINGVDINRIQKIIINCNNASIIFLYLTKVTNINVKEVEKALINTENIDYINKYENIKNNKNNEKVLKLVKN